MTKLIKQLVEAWALLGGFLLILITLVTTVNVGAFMLDRLARLLGTTVYALPGYEEFVQFSISAAALMFLPLCQYRRGHVAVDLLVNRLPRSVRSMLDRIWLSVTLLFTLFLAYWMSYGMAETRADGVVSPVLGWQEWLFYLPGIISLLLWGLVVIEQLIESNGHVTRKETPQRPLKGPGHV